jgi:hypothetical protein
MLKLMLMKTKVKMVMVKSQMLTQQHFLTPKDLLKLHKDN